MKTAQHTRPHNTKPGNPTRPLPKLLPTLLLALFFMMGGYGEVTGQVTVAEDDASNYTDWDGNPSLNEGSGFNEWTFNINAAGGSAGKYLGGTAIGDPAFGLFSGNDSNAFSRATRVFNESLRLGDTFSVDIGNTGTVAGEVGLSFLDGSTAVWTLKRESGSGDWLINDGGSDFSSGENGGTNSSLTLTFTFEGNNQYSYSLGSASGANFNFNGTVDNIDGVRFFNNDQGSGENFGINNLQITSDFQPTPSQNASDIQFTNVDAASMDVNWTSGDGDGRIVVAREGSAVSFTPANGTTYSANADYSAGTEVGSAGEGNKVVYNSTGNSFPLTGLQPETTYHFAIYEYNDNGGTAAQTAYLTTGTPTASNSTTADFIGTTGSGTLWSDTATWVGGQVPGSGDSVELSHAVTLDQDATVSSIIINSGGGELNFDANNRTLNIENGGELNNQGTFSANNGTVAFAGAGSLTGTVVLNNLNVSGAVNPGSAATVNGTLSLLSGGSVTTNTPAYGASSTLRYNTLATINPGTEWPTGSTANPINVTIEGTGTQVSFGSDGSSRTIGGNLIIGDGTTLQLSSAIGGDLRILGDWTNQGTFDSSDRAVFFEGASEQTVTNAQAGGIEIDFLFNNNTGETFGLIIDSDITVQELTNNNLLTLNSNNLTVKAGGLIDNAFTAFNISDGNTIRFEGDGQYDDESISEFSLYNLEIGGGVFINFDTTPTITNRFVINEGGYLAQTSGGDGIITEDDIPNYGDGATLVYTGIFDVNSLASGWAVTNTSKIPDNVAVEGSGELTISNTRSVSGEVNVGSGTTLNANGNLTIESGAFLLNDGTINGDIIFEREITDHSRWVSFTSPVANSLIADTGGLFDALWTQGFPDSDDPGAVGSSANVLVFNENEPGTDNDRFSAPLSNTMVTGKGYFIYIYEQKDRDDPATAITFPLTVSTQGSENPVVDPFTFNLTYTPGNGDGWNLLGNPYGASLNWADAGWGKTNIDDFAYLWNPATGNYQVTTGGDATGDDNVEGITTSDHIAPFQAFFVKANASAPVLTVPSAARSTNADNAGLFNENPAPVFTLKLEAGESESFTGFRFGEAYSQDFQQTDAYFLSPMASTFAYTYSLKQNRATMLNSLPLDLQEPAEFSVAAGAFVENAFYEGEASFSWPTFENIPEDWTITLTDTQTGEVIDLKEEQSYSFQMSATGLKQKVGDIKNFRDLQEDNSPVMDTKFAGDRFILTIDPDGTSTSTPVNGELPAEIALKQNYPNPFNPATQIAYALPEASEVRLEVFNIQGQRVATLVDGRQNAGTHEVSFEAADLASGVYLYRLSVSGENGRNILTQKMTLLK